MKDITHIKVVYRIGEINPGHPTYYDNLKTKIYLNGVLSKNLTSYTFSGEKSNILQDGFLIGTSTLVFTLLQKERFEIHQDYIQFADCKIYGDSIINIGTGLTQDEMWSEIALIVKAKLEIVYED